MSDARTVIALTKHHTIFFGSPTALAENQPSVIISLVGTETADAILAALAEAGLTPPMPTGRLHKALQDAFQAGFLSAKRDPENFSGLIAKHEYCDAALKKLSEGSE